MKTRKKKTERQKAVESLDKIFSEFIRRRKAVMDIATCVTCGIAKPWKEMQCGHYISRGKFGTRWDEKNCHVQCYACNVMLHGNYPKYARYLIGTYGINILDELELKGNSTPRFSVGELLLMVDEYKRKVELLTNGSIRAIV